MTTFVKELRDAAMGCSNESYRSLLRTAADMIMAHTEALFHTPSRVNMIALVGTWSHAERLLKTLPQEAPPAPLSGSPEPTRFGGVVEGMRKAA